MQKLFKDADGEWSWFTGGILVSLLSVGTYFIFAEIAGRNYPFGITAGFGYLAAFVANTLGVLSDNPVIKRFSEKPDAFIELFILVGLVLGGFTASKLSGKFKIETIPAEWSKHHGSNVTKRFTFVVIGGILLGYGAALAGGCTTGNILQGWAHLSLGSIVAGISFFVSGILAAQLLYGRKTGGKK